MIRPSRRECCANTSLSPFVRAYAKCDLVRSMVGKIGPSEKIGFLFDFLISRTEKYWKIKKTWKSMETFTDLRAVTGGGGTPVRKAVTIITATCYGHGPDRTTGDGL